MRQVKNVQTLHVAKRLGPSRCCWWGAGTPLGAAVPWRSVGGGARRRDATWWSDNRPIKTDRKDIRKWVMREVGTGNQEQGQIKSMIVAERAPCEAWGYVKILRRPVSALNYTQSAAAASERLALWKSPSLSLSPPGSHCSKFIHTVGAIMWIRK